MCKSSKEILEGYLGQEDWRVRENSTVNFSIGGLILYNSGALVADYWLNEVYDHEISEAHKNADFHLHDLSMLGPYCAGWSLGQLIKEGLGGVDGKISSAPAKHFSTAINQIVNFLGVLQNEWAGAQAFSSFDTYLAPFVREDKLTQEEVKQGLQSFVFGINIPSRWGTQSPFSNITLDWGVPEDMARRRVVVGGKELDYAYSECQREMDMINRAFLEIMSEGDANGRGFQYPIPTYNLTRDFDWDSENAKLLFKMTAKYGTPYFQNFINSDLDPSDVRSMCCRLRLDRRELRKRGGGLFGSDEFTGSIGVVTLNLPRMAYLSESEGEFFDRLGSLADTASRSLERKREKVQELFDKGLYPYTKRYLKGFQNHFSTIGIVGMNEACMNASWIHQSLDTPKASVFALKVLDFLRERIADYQERTGNVYNLEATPAESTAYRLASHDKKQYPSIITSGTEDAPYYTNSTHFPVDMNMDILTSMRRQEVFQNRYTGGTVFHGFLGERISDWEVARSLVRRLAENFTIPYFTISPTYSVCPSCGYLPGEVYQCSCGKVTEVYARITGYYRPLKYWNAGKQEEFKWRHTYDVPGKDI